MPRAPTPAQPMPVQSQFAVQPDPSPWFEMPAAIAAAASAKCHGAAPSSKPGVALACSQALHAAPHCRFASGFAKTGTRGCKAGAWVFGILVLEGK
jgi:hypothetical protein